MRRFKDASALMACIGEDIGYSDWVEVDQAMINQFADATHDQQWIHVDPERAATSPFGSAIAHGFLTLSLMPHFLSSAILIESAVMGVNYGLNKVRFTAPVPVNSRLRAHFHLVDVTPVDNNGIQITWRCEIQREGGDRPVCVAESVVRSYA
ncbi:MAG: MaoC family dehydratase [Comamonadaceae bacterium]|jgi:acyl dehydratase|nr:MaoC family dehydratase [Burkholderiaceae bacterium]|tara:strand:- start:110 stop:565 length:456 start_codon:yes stop_codon:yes gene_type:complete